MSRSNNIWLDVNQKFHSLPHTPVERVSRLSGVTTEVQEYLRKTGVQMVPTKQNWLKLKFHGQKLQSGEKRKVVRKVKQLFDVDQQTIASRIIVRCNSTEPSSRSLNDVLELSSLCAAMLPFFAVLKTSQQKQLCQIIRHVRFFKGEKICKQGDPADYFYCIINGTIQMVEQSKGSHVTIMGSIDAGQCFGEAALLNNTPCTHDIAAAADLVDLILIDKNTFLTMFRARYSLLRELSVHFLKKRVRLFCDVPESVATSFATHLQEGKYLEGHTFNVDESKYIFFIKEGKAAICAKKEGREGGRSEGSLSLGATLPPVFNSYSKSSAANHTEMIALTTGSFFGEQCVWEEMRLGWFVKAKTDLMVFQIAKGAFIDYADKQVYKVNIHFPLFQICR
mmetsp:Transcript_27148/g.37454  ORF Transcript_27148/g.37454 Transcript_27148/m.37454 type:complete len:394 (-) Transcript_27148:387-1568(-)